MDRAFVFTLALLISSATISMAAVPPEIEGLKVFKAWQFDTSAEGWEADHNAGNFTIKDGVLSFELTGSDPWILNYTLGGPKASDYRFLGIKMRSSVSGTNQIYFTTDKSPGFAEGKVASCQVAMADDFRFYEIDMSRIKAWDGKITALRLDTVNGPQEIGAKVEIDWIALYQRPARITLGRPYAGLDGEEVVVSLPIRNVGGEASKPGLVVSANGLTQKVGAIEPQETKSLTFRLKSADEGINVSGKLGGKPVFEAMLLPPAQPGGRRIYSENTNLEFALECPVNAALLSCGSRNVKRQVMGIFRPMAALAYRDSKGVLRYMEVGADSVEVKKDYSSAVMRSKRKIDGGEVSFVWTFEMPRVASEGLMTCELTATAPVEVLRFEGPRLLAGEDGFGSSKDHGLFPGLEYLEKDEPSSAAWHIGPKFADRHIPHPYRIAVPVMAVEAEGGVVGITWDPLAEWADGLDFICAEFESPNKSEGAANHLMTLFAPSIPTYVDENAELAAKPYRLEPGKSLKIAGRFFARLGETITDAVPKYYEAHGMPKPPPIAHGVDGTIDLCFKAYTESLYFPDKKGWKNHFGLHQTPVFIPDIAATIIAESLRTGRPELPAKCSLPSDVQIVQYTSTTLDWFSEQRRQQMEAVLAMQSEDGGFPYTITDEMMKKVKAYSEIAGMEVSTLGKVGETNSGLMAPRLNSILAYALQTGDQKFIEAGLKGLEKLNSFTVPRGAQTWEVHAHAPDVYAAGLAVDSNIAGYHLTGDEKYLDSARFWCYTGIPFAYGWTPPINPVPSGVLLFDEQGEGKNIVVEKPSKFYENLERYVNPGATIPVFGTTMYVSSWFGMPVQWCGLAWADSVRRYTRLSPDPMLESVADMVFASATQQQTEKGFLAGTYPDSWNLFDDIANMAFITPDLILDYAYSLKGEKKPSVVETYGFDLGGRRAFLNTYARIENIKVSREGSAALLEAELKFYPGQDVYVCVERAAKPSLVMVNGFAAPLAETADLRSASNGYFYDSKNSALHVKYRAPERVAELTISW